MHHGCCKRTILHHLLQSRYIRAMVIPSKCLRTERADVLRHCEVAVIQDLPIAERLDLVLREGTKKQRLLAGHILANLSTCSFASTRDLATMYGVDVATIIRFSQRLGFARYDDFRQSLRAHYLSSLEPLDLLQEQDRIPSTDTVSTIIQQDLRILLQLSKTIDHAALHDLARRISGARRVLVIGFGEHGGIAVALCHLLTYLGLDVVLETRGGIYLSAQVANLRPEDFLLSFSFWRPSTDTVQAFTWSRRHGISTAVISDSATSRVAIEANHAIVVPCEATSFFQSMTAVLSVVHALVALVAADRGPEAKEAIQRSRAYNREFGVVIG